MAHCRKSSTSRKQATHRVSPISKNFGPLMSIRLGSQLVIVGSTPKAAMEILKGHDRVLSGRHVGNVSYAKSPRMNHVSMAFAFKCNPQWKFLRTLCRTELFTSKMIEDQSYVREQKLNELLQLLVSKEGEKINIAQVVFVSIFNFLGNIILSKDLISVDEVQGGHGINGLMRELIEVFAAPNVSDLYPILSGLDLQGIRKKANEYAKRIHSAWGGIIRDRRAKKSQDSNRHGDFLDVLLHNDFSDDQINYLFLELFVAGSDTSTSTIEWTMTELIKNPKSLEKIRNELEREISGNVIKESDLPQLTYLHACVKEALRLHPPVPLLLPHCATETCQLMNCTIPKGTQVLVNVWAIGRDPNAWKDALNFDPDRFLNSEMDFRGNDFEFLPFGAGRRICPGLPMVIRQVYMALASLVYHFDWSLPDNMLPEQLDMNEKFGVTLQKEQPLVIILKQRK